MLVSSGISFIEEPLLFSHLQNRDDGFMLSVSSRLMRSYRFPFAFLLTCDRAEIIAEGEGSHEVLERALSLNPAAMRPFRYRYDGDEALERIFLLSSGIISPLFGEDTIQGQIARSLEIGRLSGTLSPQLSKLLNMAVSFSKSVHSTMKVRVFDRNIAEEIRHRLEGKGDVLIVGSGEASRIIAESLLPDHRVMMTLRDMEKTFLIPPGTVPVPYEERKAAACASDAVISSSSGLYHTFDEEDAGILSGRLLFDLSSPPDIPPSIPAVRIGDLGVEMREREAVVDKVRALASAEAARYRSWLEREGDASFIGMKAESIAYEALRRLSGPIASLGKEKEKAFREAVFDSVRKAVVSKEMEIRRS